MNTFKEFLTEQEAKSTEFKTRIFRVPVEHLHHLEDKIAKSNKKAAKLGVAPAKIVETERKFEKVGNGGVDPIEDAVIDALKGGKYREYAYLSVEGQVPVLAGGWSFVGKLEPHEAGTIVKAAPGHTLPQKYQNADPCHCEHCKKSRRRSETFIVKKGTRTYRQVGRACLKDFLGHSHPEKFADQAEWIYDIEGTLRDAGSDGWGGHGNYSYSHNVKEALAAAHAAIKRDGFVSTQAERGMPTKTTMIRHFVPPHGVEAKYHVPLNVTKEDHDAAEETIKMIKEKAKTDKSDFMQNLNKFVSVEGAEGKNFGYLAAAAMTYQKEQGQLAAKKKIGDGIISEPVGKEGEKVKLEAEVINAHKYQRNTYHYYDSGVSQILTMKDGKGRLIKMFTTNLDVKKGDKVELSGKLGKAEPESYETSPFKGKIVTMMAPRARINVKPEPLAGNVSDLNSIASIQGYPVPDNVTSIIVDAAQSDQWNTALRIYTKERPEGFTKKFKNNEIKFK